MTKQVELNVIEVNALIERLETERLWPGDPKQAAVLARAYVDAIALLRQERTTMARLRKLFGIGRNSEQTDDVCPPSSGATDDPQRRECRSRRRQRWQ